MRFLLPVTLLCALSLNAGADTFPVKRLGPKVSEVTCATTATAITTTAGRVSLCVYNTSGSASIYIGPSTVTTSNGFPIAAGGSFCDDVGNTRYYCIVSAGTVAARILEN